MTDARSETDENFKIKLSKTRAYTKRCNSINVQPHEKAAP